MPLHPQLQAGEIVITASRPRPTLYDYQVQGQSVVKTSVANFQDRVSPYFYNGRFGYFTGTPGNPIVTWNDFNFEGAIHDILGDLGDLGTSAPVEPSHVGETASETAGYAGVAIGAGERFSGSTPIGTSGKFGKLYFKPFYGNQFVTTVRVAHVAEKVAPFAIALNIAGDEYQVQHGQMTRAKFWENRAFNTIGLLGGPIGFAIETGYFALDEFYKGGTANGGGANQAALDAIRANAAVVQEEQRVNGIHRLYEP